MVKTIPHMLATTMVVFPLWNFHPVTEVPFKQPTLGQGTSMGANFKPRYKISDGKLIEISAALTAEFEAVGSLIEMGNILFKDSRDITSDEAAAMHTYFTRKYNKA